MREICCCVSDADRDERADLVCALPVSAFVEMSSAKNVKSVLAIDLVRIVDGSRLGIIGLVRPS